MIFAYPEFLFALAAISVPIIIHLFNFRRFKKVYFSDIRFLKDVEIETKSRNKLKNLLILLSRILAITFLVLAFARPFIPTGNNSETALSNIIVYVDNSFSMNADGEEGNLLEEAKAKAIEVGSAYKSGQQIRLLTNDFSPAHLRDLSFEEFKNEVSAIQPTAVTRTRDEILTRSAGSFDTQNATKLYFISDLQKEQNTEKENIFDSLTTVYALPIYSNNEANIYVDSCWFSSPTRLPLQPDELNVRVRNSGKSTVENLSVKLTINGIQRAVANTSIGSNSYEDLTLNFTNAQSGIQFAKISIQDYPITYDDSYFISYDLANSISVLSVSDDGASKRLKSVFESEPNFKFTEVSSKGLDYSLLQNTNLLILNEVSTFSSGMIQEVMKFVQNGGHLLFIPSSKSDLNSTNELLLAVGAESLSGKDSSTLKVETVNLQSDIYRNVFTKWEERIDLPTTSKTYSFSTRVNANSERLLTLSNGSSLLSSYSNNSGKCYILSTPLDDSWTNFQRHALFVPTIYNIGLNSLNSNSSAEVIGSGNLTPIASNNQSVEVLSLSSTDGSVSFIPERVSRTDGTGIYVHNQVSEAGHYLLTTEANDTIQPVSFNYDRTESLVEYNTAEEFVQSLKSRGLENVFVVDTNTSSIANEITELNQGKQLWRLFLILALACLLIEIILIRIL